ncbi:MAG TPA: hypothetical protein VN943_11700 [Candidatus Acidoferrum sp.]|nr:hypothetical protein [Candidatus Acidoferrum sp.]
MTKILERGDIFFLYRPKLKAASVRSLDDVQRFYTILKPDRKNLFRRIIIGRKRLPDVQEHERTWGFVDLVTRSAEQLDQELDRQRYQTKTRGERLEPAARPAGEGVYLIACHENHTHIAYALELPRTPGEAQQQLNIRKQASIIVTVKNPDVDSPPRTGLPSSRKPQYPAALKRKFQNKRFVDLDPPDFLNYPGTEFVLIGASADANEELGIQLHPRRKPKESADTFTELKLEPDLHPAKPLTTGRWA